jgi:DNA-binding response OmpR family regulator
MLVTALELEGHCVDEAANADEGLKRLREARYNLVLSDYAMPGHTGAWMFSEASRLGLLTGVATVIVTAQPFVRATPGIAVITKPFDLDRFLDQVRSLLDSHDAGLLNEASTGGMEMARKGSTSRGHKVELVLYVSSASPASIQARRNLEVLLSRFVSNQVEWSVRDLGREPLAGVDDRIAFTPTLVKRFPEPRLWVLGNLRETELLADMLRLCGVETKE